ncbi:MAG: glycosyltransferase, partial [ANME-2 cluster archaeon]
QINELNSAIQARDAQINELNSAIQARDAQINELNSAIQARDAQINKLNSELQAKDAQINELNSTLQSMQQSIVWRLLMKFHNGFVEQLLPISTKRRKLYDFGLNSGRTLVNEGLGRFLGKSRHEINDIGPISSEIENNLNFLDFYKNREKGDSVQNHDNTVEIIICVHNAIDDVKKCLESVVKYTTLPYSIILVDDGSDAPTKSYLEDFAKQYITKLVRNNIAKGYTFASNQALRLSIADYVVLLNSDTIVTPEWLDRMIECAESDLLTGIVGPLSNTASWQSVPEIEMSDDWAQNNLPPDISIEMMGGLIAKYSARLYPEIPFLNGFCLLIKRALIDDIGYFDEELFGEGYGEENDYCIRARKAQWNLRVADDVYIYHAQSRSYSDDRRKELCKRADKALTTKHSKHIVEDGVFDCRYDRVLEGIRARAKALLIRQELGDKMKVMRDARILLLLPVMDPGGGAYVVIQECRAMLEMGINVHLLNLKDHKEAFERNYPDLKIPIIYSEIEDIGVNSENFDAVISTANNSVDWLKYIVQNDKNTKIGYYIQDFEPHFYQEKTRAYQLAWNSYTRFPNLIRITKTKWNEEIIQQNIGVDCQIVGPSVDIDLFMPRPRYEENSQNRPIYIGAMVRPASPRRAPQMTMEILREVWWQFKDRIQIITFGCSEDDLKLKDFINDFSYNHAGLLNRQQLASLFNELDIFVDFSSFQAMGLTALEAMACGAAIIVPEAGGAKEIVYNEVNGLVIDTSSKDVSLIALNRLITNDDLRIRLGRQAIKDACEFPPEKAAYNTLIAFFPENATDDTKV